MFSEAACQWSSCLLRHVETYNLSCAYLGSILPFYLFSPQSPFTFFVSQYIIVICLTHIYSLLRVSSGYWDLFLPSFNVFSSEPSLWDLSQPERDWGHVSLSPQSESVSSPREENGLTLLSFALLTAVVFNQGRRFLLMNQYELTDTLPPSTLSSTSSSSLSLRICECYLTRLICQPPSQLLFFPSTCPSHLIPPFLCSASANRGVCVCVCQAQAKLSRARVHTGAAPFAAQGMAVKVFLFWLFSLMSSPLLLSASHSYLGLAKQHSFRTK